MKIKVLFISLLMTFTISSCDTLNSILETATGTTGTGVLSNAQIVLGLKDALKQGATEGSSIVSVTNGYFGNSLIKIPLPPEAEPIEKALKLIPGGQKLLNDAILSLNRAAEDAAKEAAPIFISAITSMSIGDGMDILFGNNDAATRYLERTTTSQLTAKFNPVIDNSLSKVGATQYWEDVMETYNKIPFVKKVDPNLSSFVTTKALEGLFVMVEKEESKIRTNIGSRSTDIMKDVFGFYDANK
ncbi:MAG: hypothetical protein ACI959_001232 [Limisphaerales bacterium]|jgi:hypothetical protein